MIEFNLNDYMAGKVPPPLPEAVASLQLQSKTARVKETPIGAINSQPVAVGDSGLNQVAPAFRQQADVKADRIDMFGYPMVMPVELKPFDPNPIFTEAWLLPIEPIVSFRGSHIISVRRVAKPRPGSPQFRSTVKERWAQDDCQVTISGFFRGPDAYTFPEAEVAKLRSITEGGRISALCPLLSLFGYGQLIVSSVELPFTKGPDMQAYVLQCYTNEEAELLTLLEDDLYYGPSQKVSNILT